MMEDVILISGYSSEVPRRVEKIKQQYPALKCGAVFFDNSNFLITDYQPLSNAVYFILEFEDGRQMHIENANCGYGGSGPNATVDILCLFGLEKDMVKKHVFFADSLQFDIINNEIFPVCTYKPVLFYPHERFRAEYKGMQNMISNDKNISVNLVEKKIIFYNPQKHCFKGFLNLLSYLEDIEFEYYIGSNSPLEGYLRMDRGHSAGSMEPDLTGITHVNLVLHSKNLKVVCFIERECEIQVMDAVYLSLTGKTLFTSERYQIFSKHKIDIKKLFGIAEKERKEQYGRIQIKSFHGSRDSKWNVDNAGCV